MPLVVVVSVIGAGEVQVYCDCQRYSLVARSSRLYRPNPRQGFGAPHLPRPTSPVRDTDTWVSSFPVPTLRSNDRTSQGQTIDARISSPAIPVLCCCTRSDSGGLLRKSVYRLAALRKLAGRPFLSQLAINMFNPHTTYNLVTDQTNR